MKSIYFIYKGIKYRVSSKKIDTDSNYNVGIRIFRAGTPYCLSGTMIKETDDLKEEGGRLLCNYIDWIAMDNSIFL